jgi:hypothetical protein
MRLLITAALAMMNTFVVENRRGRRAATFSSFPMGTDVLNAGIIVGLLKTDSRRGVYGTTHLGPCAGESDWLLL